MVQAEKCAEKKLHTLAATAATPATKRAISGTVCDAKMHIPRCVFPTNIVGIFV